MRLHLSKLAGVTATFSKPALFTFSTPLEIEISGYDLTILRQYSDKLAELMSAEERFVDVQTTLQNGNPELNIQFNHAKLAQLGLNATDVSRLIANKVGDSVASQYNINDDKVDILVRTLEQNRDSIRDIHHLIVNPGGTPAIPLDAVANITLRVQGQVKSLGSTSNEQ